jgi:acetyl-CoA acetyltransferase
MYVSMGQTAENVASRFDVSRVEQDEFALRSQSLAEKAIADGFWAHDITPVVTPDGTSVSADDCPRPGTTLEGLSALKPPSTRRAPSRPATPVLSMTALPLWWSCPRAARPNWESLP